MKDKLKILAICQEDPEWLLGGMGRHLQELYKAMAKKGDVSVDLLVGGPAHTSYSYNGFQKHHSHKLLCYKPKSANMASLLISDIQLATTLMKLIAEGHRWDLIHVHEWNSIQVARMAREALGVPMVGTMHLCITRLMEEAGSNPMQLREPDIYLMQQEGHLIVDVDELILCSQAYIDMARKTFMTDRPINLIYNGIDMKKWTRDPEAAAEVKRRLSIYTDKPVALYAGRIAEMKGIRELLAAIEDWPDCPYMVILAGEVNAHTAADRDNWDVTIKIRELEECFPHRFKWVGFQDDKNLHGLYSLAEIGLMPSIHEPFGIVALEFMSMGVPLICTDVGGLGEIVTDDAGKEYAFIIDPGKSRDIRDAALFLRQRPQAREELIQLGLERARFFNWDQAAAQTVDLYHRTVNGRA